MPPATKYSSQRARKIPPHVSLGALRKAAGLTIDDLIARIQQARPDVTVTRGAISAIEQGHRGASEQMLSALCAAYGLPDGSITTNYLPRRWDAA